MMSARIVVNSIALVSTVALARLLTPEDFGVVAIVIAATAITTAITQFSLAEALIKIDHPTDRDYDTVWTLNLFRAIGLCTILIGLSFPVAHAFDDQRLVPLFLVSALGVAFGAMQNPRIVIFRRKLDFRPAFQFSTVEKVVSFVVAIGIAFVYRSYWALVLGTVAAAAVRLVMTYIKVPYRPRFDLSSWRTLMSFSIWLTLAEVTKTLNSKGMPLIAAGFLSTNALGQYTFGERLASMPVLQSTAGLKSTLFPAFSRMSGDLSRMRAAYMRAQGVICLVALPIGFGIAAVAQPLVVFGLGEKWLPSVPVIQALAAMSGLHAIQFAQPLAMATGNTKDVFLRNLRALALRVPLAIGGLTWGQSNEYGALVGLSVGLVLAGFANLWLNMSLVRRLIDCSLIDQWRLAARPLVAAIAMLGAVVAMDTWLITQRVAPDTALGLAILIGVGGMTYLGSLFALHFAFGGEKSAESEVARMAKSVLVRAFKRPAQG